MGTSVILPPLPGLLLHPVLDVRPEVMSLGFSVQQEQGNKVVSKPFHIASDGRRVKPVKEAGEQVLAGQSLRYQEGGALPDLDAQWPREDFVAFMADPRCPNSGDLYRDLMTKVRTHVELDHEGKYVILACWIVLTYVYPLFPAVPFLHIVGPKGTGKTQLLEVLEQLVRNAHRAAITRALTGDMMEYHRPTLLTDQVDHLPPELSDTLAASYRYGSRRSVTNTDDRTKPLTFGTFGPKALAGTEALPVDLRDRAIVLTTVPARVILAPVPPEDSECAHIRGKCYAWALLSFWKLPALLDTMRETAGSALLREVWPGLASYQGRQHELWLPMEVLMEALRVPEADREQARDYYQRSQAATKAELREDHIELLELLCHLVGGDATLEITSTRLLEQLSDDEDENGRPLWTPLKLGMALRTLTVLKRNERTVTRDERRYVIDGNAVRSLAERYGLLPKEVR